MYPPCLQQWVRFGLLLQAVMMGPFVMAGISHNDRLLRLPASSSAAAAAAAASLGANAGAPVNIADRVYLPEEADELLSLQVGDACCAPWVGNGQSYPGMGNYARSYSVDYAGNKHTTSLEASA